MKSRSLLLAAMLFTVPAFADQTPAETPQTKTEEPAKNKEIKKEEVKVETKKEDAGKTTDVNKEVKTEETTEVKPSWLYAQYTAFAGLGTTAMGYTIDPLAKYSTIPALKQLLHIEYLKGGKFERNIPTIGKTMIACVLVAAAVYGYKLATADADDVDNDDETFFSN